MLAKENIIVPSQRPLANVKLVNDQKETGLKYFLFKKQQNEAQQNPRFWQLKYGRQLCDTESQELLGKIFRIAFIQDVIFMGKVSWVIKLCY